MENVKEILKGYLLNNEDKLFKVINDLEINTGDDLNMLYKNNMENITYLVEVMEASAVGRMVKKYKSDSEYFMIKNGEFECCTVLEYVGDKIDFYINWLMNDLYRTERNCYDLPTWLYLLCTEYIDNNYKQGKISLLYDGSQLIQTGYSIITKEAARSILESDYLKNLAYGKEE